MTTPVGAVASDARGAQRDAARTSQARKSGGGDGFFTKKYGPLPGWGWSLIAGGAALAYLWWRSREKAAASSAAVTAVTASSSGTGYAGSIAALQQEIDALQGYSASTVSGSGGGVTGTGGGTTTTTTSKTTAGSTSKTTSGSTSKTTGTTTSGKTTSTGTSTAKAPYPAPAGLHVRSKGKTSFTVAWDKIPGNVSGYVISLEKDKKTTQTETLPVTATTKNYAGLTKGGTYTVRLRGARPGSAQSRVSVTLDK